MSTPAADNKGEAAPAAPASPNQSEGLDPSVKLLFDTVESEKSEKNADDALQSERMNGIHQAIGENPLEEKKKEEKSEAKPDEKKQEAKPGTESKGEAPKPDTQERQIGVRRRPSRQAAATPPPPPPAPKQEKADEQTKKDDPLAGIELVEEEKENLALAQYAERKDPTKYAGLTAKFQKFIKAHADFIAEEKKRDPEATFDANNPRYQQWLQTNRPNLSAVEVRSLERSRAADEARESLRPELERVNDELFRRDEEPKVRAMSDQVYNAIADSAFTDDMKKVLKEHGVEKLREQFPFEVAVAHEIADVASSDIAEMSRLLTRNPNTGRPLAQFDANNQQHQRVLKVINDMGNAYKRAGQGLVRNGKHFLTRAEFFALPKEQRGAYWTFDVPELVDRSRHLAQHAVKLRIKQEEERLQKLGFRRGSAAAPTPPQEPPPPPAPGTPRGAAPVTPGAGGSTDTTEKATSLLLGSEE